MKTRSKVGRLFQSMLKFIEAQHAIFIQVNLLDDFADNKLQFFIFKLIVATQPSYDTPEVTYTDVLVLEYRKLSYYLRNYH